MIKKITLKGLFLSRVTTNATKDTFPLNNTLMEWNLDKDGLVLDNTNWVVIGLNGLNESSFSYSKNGNVLNGIRRSVMKEFSIQMYRTQFDSHEYLELPCDNSIKYSLEFTSDDGYYVIDDVYPKKVERTNERYLTLTFIIGKIMKKSGSTVTQTLSRVTTYEALHYNVGYSERGYEYTIPQTIEQACRRAGYPVEICYQDETDGNYYTTRNKLHKLRYSKEYIYANYSRSRTTGIYEFGDYYFFETNATVSTPVLVGYSTITQDTESIPYDVLTVGWNTASSGYVHTTTTETLIGQHDGIYPEDIMSLNPTTVSMVLQKNTHRYMETDLSYLEKNNHAPNIVAILYNNSSATRMSTQFRHDCTGFTYAFRENCPTTSITVKYSLWDEVYSIV